jgi:hypothetical protein
LGGNEKFVNELAEAMPSARAAVFLLMAKIAERGAFDGWRAVERIVFPAISINLRSMRYVELLPGGTAWRGNGRR